ncbi:MAG TPA: hypothetical protein VLC09_15320 [Polyangiaceae bacterium]|nr:hypothetical protein [Polyangiaceae bacterium]
MTHRFRLWVFLAGPLGACGPPLEVPERGEADGAAYFGPELTVDEDSSSGGNRPNPWLGGGGSVPPELVEKHDGSTGGAAVGAGSGGSASPPVNARLIISRYHETVRGAKYLEFTLQGGRPPSAGECTLDLFTNGRTTVYRHVSLPAVTDRVLACTASTPPAEGCVPALGSALFNGNDALVVRCGGEVTDSFGQVGFDPGVAWLGDGLSTKDQLLLRCPGFADRDPHDAFTPALEWVTPTTQAGKTETDAEALARCSGLGGAGGASP